MYGGLNWRGKEKEGKKEEKRKKKNQLPHAKRSSAVPQEQIVACDPRVSERLARTLGSTQIRRRRNHPTVALRGGSAWALHVPS